MKTRSRKAGKIPEIRPIVLTIAGSDSGAGAGIQADSRSIHALGGFATTAITAVTAQNTRGVVAWRAEPPDLIAAQISAVCSDLPIAAVKTGLLPGAAAISAVASALRKAKAPLVIDPVIGSTSGTRFLPPAGVKALLKELLPLATLITPNWAEAAVLTGRSVATFDEAEEAARALLENSTCKAVLVKGGHAPGNVCRDVLVQRNGTSIFSHPRIESNNTHGTGCVLSAAIATRLAHGDDVHSAVARAISFLQRALKRGADQSWGAGHGPAFAS